MVAERQRGERGEGSIQPYPGGRFRARLTVNGVKKSKVVATRADARKAIREWNSLSDGGMLIAGIKSPLIDLVPQWLAAMAINRRGPGKLPEPMKMSTLQSFEQKIDAYIRWSPIASVRVSDLTGDHIAEFIGSLADGTFAAAKTKAIEKQIAALKITDPQIGFKTKALKAKIPTVSRYSVSIQRQCYAAIRDILRWAVHEKLVTRNVAVDFDPPEQQTNAVRDAGRLTRVQREHGYELAAEDRLKIREHAMNNPKHSRMAARWILMVDYGLRPGEALALTVDDYDRDNRILSVRRQIQHKTHVGEVIVESAKSDAGNRDIHIGPEMHKMLVARIRTRRGESRRNPNWKPYTFEGQEFALLFTQADGKAISQRLDDVWWKKLLASAEVAPVRKYVGRHSAVSEMMATPGADHLSISQMIGHSDPAFTAKRYGHALNDRKRALAETIGQRDAASLFDLKESMTRQWLLDHGYTPHEWDEDGELKEA